ncbi:MAG: hypothetical protein JNK29_10965, partial [Anaerolineales bacterium]|nr:hypothetical protein [Anaerolineales bacterium]
MKISVVAPASSPRRLSLVALALSLGLGGALALLAGPAGLTRAAADVDLGIVKSASGPAVYGQPLTYTLVLTSGAVGLDGPATLTDTLPAGLTPVTATTSSGAACTLANPVVCSFASLGANSTASATIVVDVAGAGVYTNTVTAAVSASDTESFLANNTYTLATTIAPATPVITWPAPVALTYGAALGGAQLNASTPVAGAFAYSPAAGAVLGAGAHTLTAVFTPADSANYAVVTATTSLTVNPAPLTIAANSVSRSYGAANPSFTAVYTGFVNGDTAGVLSGALTVTATQTTPAGAYAIASTRAGPNYAVTYVPGALTITPAPLTVTANNQSKAYGAALPALGVSYSGFMNSETSAVLDVLPTAGTTATQSSPAGTYAITASAGADANYTFS